MIMRKILNLFTVIVSTYCFGQVPNDLQLSGIKGKVKSMTIDKNFTSGYKSRDVFNYNEAGYSTSDFLLDNELESGGYSSDVQCVGGQRYSAFSSSNSRAVFPKYCDSSEEETKYKDYLEFWTDNRQKVYVYDMRYSEGEKYIKRFYNEEYKLVKEEYYHTITYEDKTHVSSVTSDYTYDNSGNLIKVVQHSNYDGKEDEIIFTNKVIETDKHGNIKKRSVIVDAEESLSEYSYEYY